jgi:hypothetical protein
MRANRDPYPFHRTHNPVPIHRTAPVASRQWFPRMVGWLGMLAVAMTILSIIHAVLREVL